MKFVLDRDGKTLVTTVKLRHNPKAEPGMLENIRGKDVVNYKDVLELTIASRGTSVTSRNETRSYHRPVIQPVSYTRLIQIDN